MNYFDNTLRENATQVSYRFAQSTKRLYELKIASIASRLLREVFQEQVTSCTLRCGAIHKVKNALPSHTRELSKIRVLQMPLEAPFNIEFPGFAYQIDEVELFSNLVSHPGPKEPQPHQFI